MASLLGTPDDPRRRARLALVCAVCAVIGFASKRYGGLGRGVVVGQFEDFFGTVFLILALRVVVLRAPMWKVAGSILAIVCTIELSQRLHGGLIERARSTWLGMHVLGACFGWDDMATYFVAAGVAVVLDRRLAPARPLDGA
jgi:hypothetical protein